VYKQGISLVAFFQILLIPVIDLDRECKNKYNKKSKGNCFQQLAGHSLVKVITWLAGNRVITF